MRKGRPLAPISIAVGDRAQLVAWSKRPKTAQALAMRSRIVLLASDGLSNTAIASQLHTMQHTVGKWRRRYLKQGLDGLLDEPRPGTSRKLRDKDVERVLALTLESTPTNATHWSTRSMAKRAGLSRASIHRIWQAFSLAPHRSETFKLSKDPLFIDKVRDIVGLYLAPPERALVLCVDEKSQIQALDRTAPLLPMRPGQIERRTHDYARHGTTSLFAALDTKTGVLIGQTRRRHRSVEFRSFLDTIERNVPPDLDKHLILAYFGKLAQLGRTLACSADRKAAPPRCPSLHQRTGKRHPQLYPAPQQRTKTLCLAQDRRPDPRLSRSILYPNFRDRTLEETGGEVAIRCSHAVKRAYRGQRAAILEEEKG